ncbi:dTDP-4-dehydrorhamnose reductase [Epibacterium sp. SM1969]|uniref:dTDP-4-dehydrorhamnose reductase n=1 Tax=Tritonibacter aquimaris TaxID=2663379 RepID=A0A844ANG7_9RHOB|nr:dTDP-4-dehydrorhamnose reductase [Tritonibacter aquimaris]MQY44150.1 dTDP-4-dehydrorhamnose reductase [Tritonibacter aquimaris]
MILVFGKTGQVAQELSAHAGITCVGRDQADLSDPAACAALIRAQAPTAVINAAAYTAVDKAEEEEELATQINGDAPAAMAAACAALDIPFVHISTDYVFSGTGETPWKTDDPVAPPNAYGRSKLRGEEGVRAGGGRYAILRTSWVVSAHGHNFVKTMLRLGAERDKLTIISDQIGAPTSARDIAAACVEIAHQLGQDGEKSGSYHFQGAPFASWADFARAIFEISGTDCAVEDIPTTAYPTPAVRPLNSRLNCQATEDVFGISQPSWQQGLSEILKDLGAAS